MAWETRKGRGRYYTRSRRVGGRVVREYLGVGYVGELAARMDGITKAAGMLKRQEMQDERSAFAALDDSLDDLDHICRQLVQAALHLAGYCQHHRGEWRKKREQKKESPQSHRDTE